MGGVLALVTKATVTRMRSAWARVSMLPDDSVYLSSAVPSARCFVLCPCSLDDDRRGASLSTLGSSAGSSQLVMKRYRLQGRLVLPSVDSTVSAMIRAWLEREKGQTLAAFDVFHISRANRWTLFGRTLTTGECPVAALCVVGGG